MHVDPRQALVCYLLCRVVGTTARGPRKLHRFQPVAGKPEFNETTVAYFLQAPHPRMSDMNLSRSEAVDLAAYIKEQR